MTALTKAPYVFIARGKVLISGQDPQSLFDSIEERALGGAAVKSWRVHTWGAEAGDQTNVLTCVSCKEARRSDGSNHGSPCPFPERHDSSVQVFKVGSELLLQQA